MSARLVLTWARWHVMLAIIVYYILWSTSRHDSAIRSIAAHLVSQAGPVSTAHTLPGVGHVLTTGLVPSNASCYTYMPFINRFDEFAIKAVSAVRGVALRLTLSARLAL